MDADQTPAHGDQHNRHHARATPGAPSVGLRNAAVFMAVVTGVFALKYFNVILTPLVIAVFLLMLSDGLARKLESWFPRWPGWLRSTLGAALIIGGFAGVVVICARYGRDFAGQLTVIQQKVDEILAQGSDRLGVEPVNTKQYFITHGSTAIGAVFGAARGVLSGGVLVFIYLGFLLASRPAFGRKMRRMFGAGAGRAHASRVFTRVRVASEQYVGLQTLKALMVAVVAWVIMALLQVKGASFLAFLFFLASYVPIIGGIVGVILPTLMALAQFGDPGRPLLLLALLTGAVFAIENVLMPKLASDRLNLDPVAVLVSLGFWGSILGVPGALLSTPLTVVVMAIAAEFEGTRWLAMLLSKDGDLGGELP
jgi:predicted PurR-regulated permease PerM